MTVATPSDVQPSEPAADASNGVSVRTASAVWILIAGVVGLAAALTLTVEKIEILINPDYVPSCSINPVLSCGSVMVTPQASAFGFPNPLIGIVSFTVVVVTGVLALAKIRLPRWYWVGLATGTLLGVAFIHWLIFRACTGSGRCARTAWRCGRSPSRCSLWSPRSRCSRLRSNVVARVLYTWRWSLVALWFTALVLMILVRFWNYWSTLI